MHGVEEGVRHVDRSPMIPCLLNQWETLPFPSTCFCDMAFISSNTCALWDKNPIHERDGDRRFTVRR